MNIGYIRNSYPEQRCIIGATRGGYRFIDYRYTPHYLRSEILSRTGLYKGETNYKFYFQSKKRYEADIFHTFNTVCNIPNDWCVTFESTVPRNQFTIEREWEKRDIEEIRPNRLTEKELQLLSSERCIGIFALSQSAYDIQKQMLDRMCGEWDGILKKTTVLHPPQQLLISTEELQEKFHSLDDCMEMIFVGNDFFRKGGKELVDALCMYEGKYKFHLSVVSNLNYGDYASQATEEERNLYREILQEKNWISWLNNIPNREVLELCKKAHIGFLPTLADTYGYSVLEMQACGCPVVTTDIRALPEINNETCGWLVHLEKRNVGGEAVLTSDEDRKQRKMELSTELNGVLEAIFLYNEQLIRKGIESYNRIKTFHDPIKYGEKLEKYYSSRHGMAC